MSQTERDPAGCGYISSVSCFRWWFDAVGSWSFASRSVGSRQRANHDPMWDSRPIALLGCTRGH